jgi:SAM-dependent methyltransferase
MLTVDFDRLGVRSGDRLLDLGCGGGRHAFEAYRRGARVVALDRDFDELATAAATLEAMHEAGQEQPASAGAVVRGDALSLPFPDGAFDRVIAAEVLEHIPGDTDAMAELVRVLRPGGTMAVTVPRWLPERVCWALSDEYHGKPGGHIRIYRAGQLAARLRAAGLVVTGSHHAHALHSPYWWLKCAVGVDDETQPLVRLYHRFLVWDMTHPGSVVRRLEDAVLNPLIGKSLVLYAARPAAPLRPPLEKPVRAAA